jgi:K+-transporting ATPase ATPase A chain
VLVSQGVVQTFHESKTVALVQPTGDVHEQVIAVGPAASQIAIKQLGTNGGGFFTVNAMRNPPGVIPKLYLLRSYDTCP